MVTGSSIQHVQAMVSWDFASKNWRISCLLQGGKAMYSMLGHTAMHRATASCVWTCHGNKTGRFLQGTAALKSLILQPL